MGHAISFRTIEERDLPFLRRVYASTRQEEMDQSINWTEQQKADFLAQQFHAQHTFYQQQFAAAEYLVVLLNGQPAGRLYIDRRPDEIRLIDIALLPAFRGHGVRSALLKDVLDEGRRGRKPVRIHVEQFNPALRLYQRLGFRIIGDTGVYYFMEWRPDGAGEHKKE